MINEFKFKNNRGQDVVMKASYLEDVTEHQHLIIEGKMEVFFDGKLVDSCDDPEFWGTTVFDHNGKDAKRICGMNLMFGTDAREEEYRKWVEKVKLGGTTQAAIRLKKEKEKKFKEEVMKEGFPGVTDSSLKNVIKQMYRWPERGETDIKCKTVKLLISPKGNLKVIEFSEKASEEMIEVASIHSFGIDEEETDIVDSVMMWQWDIDQSDFEQRAKEKIEKLGFKIVKKNWGGKREGAGRPAGTNKKFRGFRLNDEEYVEVKKFIDKLRKM